MNATTTETITVEVFPVGTGKALFEVTSHNLMLAHNICQFHNETVKDLNNVWQIRILD